MSKKLKPTKDELAQYKVMNDMGMTAHAIATRIERDPKTVRKYLKIVDYNTPEMKEMVATIKTSEINDLYLIGAKARSRIHEKLDDGDMKPIELVATMDRSFQQRRLLQGESTENIAQVHHMIAMLKGVAHQDKQGAE